MSILCVAPGSLAPQCVLLLGLPCCSPPLAGAAVSCTGSGSVSYLGSSLPPSLLRV